MQCAYRYLQFDMQHDLYYMNAQRFLYDELVGAEDLLDMDATALPDVDGVTTGPPCQPFSAT